MFINKKVTVLGFLILVAVAIFLIFCFLGNGIFQTHGRKLISSLKNKKNNIFAPKKNPNLPDYPFTVGEKLKYGIYSTFIKVGEATITYLGDKELNGVIRDLVVLEVRAPGFRDVEKIYGDIDSFSPIRVERKIRLFGEKIDIVEEYDQSKNEVTITRKAKKTTVKKIVSKEKIGNVILLLYHFRNKNNAYKLKDKIEFNLPTKKLEMLVDKITEIKVPKGRFQATFVRSIPSRFKVWFNADDEDKIPLRIEGAIGFGNTYLALLDFERPK